MGDLPSFDFSGEAMNLDESSESWKELTNRVREACETHGCFLVKFDGGELPLQLRQTFFTALKALFDLPAEIKEKYTGSAPFSRYERTSSVSEYFGIDESNKGLVARDFTALMWPDDHHNLTFCKALNEMSSKMLELTLIVLKMVFKSYNILDCDESIDRDSTSSHFRLMKYEAPSNGDPKTSAIGFIPHTDKNFLTILFENGVQGLEVLSKEDGKWSPIIIPNQSFIIFLGDSFKAWSNGRFHSAKHSVITREAKVRYSCALFLMPKADATVEVSRRFVDEDHPLLYRPFSYSDFMNFYASNNFVDGALELFAGI